jgi:D-alanyl-D-alanine carboxypeptidase
MMPLEILEHAEVASQLDLLCAWIEAQLAYKGQPGLSIGIVLDQQLVWAKGFGFANVAAQTPTTPSTIYRIASITKLFTSTAIMQLRDAGKLQLDDPITKHLAWFELQNHFPDAPPITLRHLLTHTSGLPREAAFPYWIDNDFPTMAQIRRQLPNQTMALPTETKWKYSNLGLSLLGEIVAAVAGVAWADYIETKILQPLDMQNTFTAVAPKHPLLATGYGRRLPDQSRGLSPYTDTNGIAASANMASNVEDLARLAMLHFRTGPQQGHQILRGSSLREMQRVHWLSKNWQAGRGLGFYVWRFEGKTLSGHGGALQGYRTDFQLCPEDKIAVIVLTNADDGAPLTYFEKVFKWVVPALLKAAAPKPKAAQPDSNLQRYTGKFRSVWGDEQVILLNNELVLLDPSLPEPLLSSAKLIPVAEHTFRIETEENFGSDGELAVFELDDKGKIIRLVLGNTPVFPVEEW